MSAFPFPLPNGIEAPDGAAARPNWCGGKGGTCGKPAVGKTGRCPPCADLEFTKRIVARREKATAESDGRELARIENEIALWRAKGRRCFA